MDVKIWKRNLLPDELQEKPTWERSLFRTNTNSKKKPKGGQLSEAENLLINKSRKNGFTLNTPSAGSKDFAL